MASLAPPAPKSSTPKLAPPSSSTRERKAAPVQAKLKVNSPSDPLERQADQTADRVMRAAKPFPMAGPRAEKVGEEKVARKPRASGEKVARKTSDEKVKRKASEEKVKRKASEEKVKRKASDERVKRKVEPAASSVEDKTAQRDAVPGAASSQSGVAPAGFEASLGRAQQAGGSPLSGDTLHTMESGLGQSLDHVRIYNDGPAAGLADSIDARAFTLGHDIFFGHGEYQPHTYGGRHLLAHELAHVVQQSEGVASKAVQRNGTTAGTGSTTTPVSTGSPTSTASTEPPQEDPPTFPGANNQRIVKQAVGDKQGTFYLNSLVLPQIGGSYKGIGNHSNPGLAGRAAAGKNPLTEPFLWTGKTERGSTSARRTWIEAAQGNAALQTSLADAVRTRLGAGGGSPAAGAAPAAAAPAPIAAGDQPAFYLKRANDSGPIFYIIGSAEEVARNELVVLPTWDSSGAHHSDDFAVDHINELQLGGLDGWDNFCLLDSRANSSSGSLIFNRFKQAVEGLIGEASRGGFWPGRGGSTAPNFDQVRAGWQVQFTNFTPIALGGNPGVFWTRGQIQAGDHLTALRAMTEDQIIAANLRLRPNHWPNRLQIFSDPTGGFSKRLDRTGDTWSHAGRADFYRGVTINQFEITRFDTVEQNAPKGLMRGTALGRASKNGKIFPPINVEIPLKQSRNLGYGLWVDREAIRNQLRTLRFNQASPVEIEDAGISAVGVLFVEGRILTDLPLFAGTQIPFAIYGDELTIEFPIPTDRLHLGPVSVTEAALQIGVNPDGLALGGMVGFEVRGVGRGRIDARASTEPAAAPAGGAPAPAGAAAAEGSGFSLAGMFNFDFDTLDPASIAVAYANHQFTVDANVGLREGAVRGLRSASIHVHSGPEGILFEGTAVLGIPSLEGTTLQVSRNPEGDIQIGADNIPLPVARIPGVRSATANIHVLREAETGAWHVSGGGAAEIGIGGVTGTLRVDVAGPFLTITGERIELHRGPLEGSGNFVVTNRPRDESGRPLEEGEPTEMTASGHAEASLPLGPYLRGTIGGTILPNGELEFTGGLALPPTVDLFDQRRFDRELFRPPSLDIPIFGISAAGQRIGIFATIGGSLSFSASVGPGQLRDTALTATFNPDHPEATTVHGTANFVVPAQAGLRLEIHGGIGAGIPIVSAEAGIEIGGSLGIAAEASAAVTVDWSPSTGLAVQAVAHLHAQPQFTFDISAYLRIVADVVITEFELYNERWTLASFTFGPELTFGIDLPVAWTEQAGLDFDLNRIEIQRPDIDFSQIGSDLMHHLVG